MLYKVLVCDKCFKEIKLGEESKDWMMLSISKDAAIFAKLTGSVKVPEHVVRRHICPVCLVTFFPDVYKEISDARTT